MSEHNIDKFDVDVDGVIASEESKNTTKVNFLQLPKGEGVSVWRIIPWPKRRTFFKKISKHWYIPGIKGTLTCPRSFEDPNTGKLYPCGLCDKSWELYKTSDPINLEIAKSLRASDQYYMNAVNMNELEKGVGVLSVPYGIWKTLYDYLTLPDYKTFWHVKYGRNITFKASFVKGAKVDGNKKREFSVIPSPTASEILDYTWLDNVYDLDTIFGIPTYEFTSIAAHRILTKDETYGEQSLGEIKRYRALGAPESSPPATLPQEYFPEPTPQLPSVNEPVSEPQIVNSTPPVFATAPVTLTGISIIAPTEVMPDSGHKPCFGKAFDLDNKICLRCPENMECEKERLKNEFQAKKSAKSVDAVEKMMEEALRGKA